MILVDIYLKPLGTSALLLAETQDVYEKKNRMLASNVDPINRTTL